MGNRAIRSSKLLSLTALLAILLSVVLLPLPARAQAAPETPAPETPAPGVQVTTQADGVGLTLNLPAVAAAADINAFSLPLVRYGGYHLPMQTVTVALPNAQQLQVTQEVLAAGKFDGVLTPAAPPQPPTLDVTPNLNVIPESLRLPQQPVFVLRSGQIRGLHYAVVAVSPIFEQNGQIQVATRVEAALPGAVLDDRAAALVAGAVAQNEPVNVPVNDAALKSSFKLTVSSPGIQEVHYADLGLSAEPAAVRVALNGQPVAVEKLGDRLRFYAPTVGDRWNATSTYWLTLEVGPLIPSRAPAPDATPGVVFEQGRWVDNKLYDSFYPGADGDHWFHKDMRVDPSIGPTAHPTATVPATTVLPLRAGDSTFVVNTTAFVRAPGGLCLAGDKGYKLEAQMRSGNNELDASTVTWDPAPNCILAPTNALTFTTPALADSLRLRLMPNDLYGTGLKLESVDWLRPVTLDFAGLSASNIEFWTEAGPWTYTWSNLPTARSLYLPLIVAPGNAAATALAPATALATHDFVFAGSQWQLYDVTDPANPLLVSATATGFNQGSETARRHYVLSNLSLPLRPAITRHSATDFGNVKAADAIYIGPAAFADTLKPLLALRQQQGHTPLFVDVQAIYDVYGFGQISAPAIRNFLRSNTDWQNAARNISVVLVGDATYDPFGFEGQKNSILVAAWIDDVDPFMGETACDTCFAQLNGDDPKSGDYTPGGPPWFAADLWLGRFPVRSVEELTDVVAKIVSYETTGSDSDTWRARQVYLADNYIKALDSQLNARPDDAGDFAALSDAVVDRIADGAVIRRIYYDPAPQRQIAVDGNGPVPAAGKPGYFVTGARSIAESWRQSDAAAANISAVQYLSSGAGLFVYNGHANHFQFATTSENRNDPLRWLLYTNDVGFINNQGKPFIQLSMTCYTSMFIKPTFNGTLDELIFRRKDAGAVAIWGPTGQSVVNGHQLLTEGFIDRLYSTATTQPMGQLVEAGYTKLLLANTSYLDPLMTFVLLGDPLTPARITARQLYLPTLQK